MRDAYVRQEDENVPINVFTTIDDPSTTRGTSADGIKIVSSFDIASSFEGFVRNSDGTFITLNLPSGNLGTEAEDHKPLTETSAYLSAFGPPWHLRKPRMPQRATESTMGAECRRSFEDQLRQR
jgi:hypothetical protein